MDIEKIYEFIEKTEKSSFDKIEIQIQDIKLCLERHCGRFGHDITEIQSVPKEQKIQEVAAPKEDKQAINTDDVITAPISGVFYVAKEPGAEPFVKEGCRVKKGDTVCIIEAMKMMNEISAPKTGIIERVLLSDAKPVSVNDLLFIYAKED